MRPLYTVTIPGRPVPFARTGGGGAHRFDPAQYRAWKATARVFVIGAQGPRGMAQRVRLEVDAVFPRPAARPDGVTSAEWSTGSRVRRAGTEDLDNVVKAVADVLQPAKAERKPGARCLYPLADDRWIVSLGADAWYAAAGENPCVVARIGWPA